MTDSPFTEPRMECRNCGKPMEGHGPYCYPVADRLIIVLIVAAGLAVVFMAFYPILRWL